MELIVYILGGLALFLIILGAVKMAVKEALYEIKEDIIKEFNLKKVNADDIYEDN
ncbi:hypothetical protein [Clostridium sp. BNL1100]|uniref:hypothetical protein n=1 Tax=Clostridium sp. BNL1100 TaxID=755731 RepID=UPI00024A75C3|nr:hypothetical protein [Clostridium sp. BNL1100]AEY65579.1 hypothetical protein Clo1100_1340 [Clostridium sp. BNL1100]